MLSHTHLGLFAIRLAEGVSLIRALPSTATACTRKACVISNHIWMQALLRRKNARADTRSVRRAVTNASYDYSNHTSTYVPIYRSHSDSLCSFVVILRHMKPTRLQQKAVSSLTPLLTSELYSQSKSCASFLQFRSSHSSVTA